MAVATEQLTLFLLTADGLVRCCATERLDGLEALGTALEGENLREVCQDPFNPRRFYAASTADVYLSEDGGETWDQLATGGVDFRQIWTMAVHPTRPNQVFIGTMPALVGLSENGGRSFRELAGLRALPDYARWTFPSPPHSPTIRCITLDARVPDEMLVGIEEGGLARSRDAGATWEDITGPPSDIAFPRVKDVSGQTRPEPGQLEPGRVYRDVHWIARHPTRLDTLYVTTGMGTYRSQDAAQSWTRLDVGRDRGYVVPLAIHPAVPERLFVGAAENGPPAWKSFRTPRTGPFNSGRFRADLSDQLGGARAAVWRSDDGGDTWRELGGGLPVSSPYMVCSLRIHPHDPAALVAAYTDGSLYHTLDAGETWQQASLSCPKLYGVRVFAQA
jgi:hypothetical protein